MKDTLPTPVAGPAIVNVSGGRSSGLMLHMLLRAHGGALPADVVPVFCNTGEEAEGTLVFVREMAERWGVRIRWIEFVAEPRAGAAHDDLAHWREVDYCTASRNGEPFDALVNWKRYLPNPTQRICSEWLKVRAAMGFAASLGFPTKRVRNERTKRTDTVADFTQCLGIRADEPRRIATNREKEMPLVDAGIARGDVLRFWSSQPFDLHIREGEGNCRLCFEKGIPQLRNVARTAPDEAGLSRWVDRERRIGASMKKAQPYALIERFVRHQLPMFDEPAAEGLDLRPCACGD